MKKLLLTILCLQIAISPYAQSGFNKIYTFLDYPAGGFDNAMVIGNDIYLFTGLNHDSIPGYTGMAMVKADTNGNIKQIAPFFEPNLRGIAMGANFPIFLSSNGKIAVGGLYWSYTSGFIASFDQTDFLFTNYAEVSHTGYHFQSDLVELSDGWLTIGAAHAYSGNLRNYASRVDKQGNILWTKYYGDNASLNYITSSVLKLDENTIVIGAAIKKIINGPPYLLWAKPWIFAVDTLGEVKWEWVSPKNNVGDGGPGSLHKLENGDWLHTTSDCNLDGTPYPPCWTKVVRRDSAWNLIWQTRISPTDWYRNQPLDMKLSPDGNYIVATESAPGPAPDQPQYIAGCLHKITPDGKELWMVCDTAFFDTESHWQEPVVGGLVVLPSGSSILIGGVTRWAPDPPQSYGWMFKVDANGCMYAPCSVPVEAPEAPGIALSVYPNPASEHFTVRLPELSRSAVLETYDALGRLVVQLPVSPGQEAVSVSAVGWHAGLYAIRLVQQGRVLGAYRVVIK